jgi:hypothetical protein
LGLRTAGTGQRDAQQQGCGEDLHTRAPGIDREW